MSFEAAMRGILPPVGGQAPHVTSDYGTRRGAGRHGGVDFNYVGGQRGLNLRHPTVHAPVDGTVVFSGGRFGTVKIRDAQGHTHELLHLHRRAVRVGEQVHAGAPIGTMGGRGPGGPHAYAQHVHYQLRDARGRLLDPRQHWEHGGQQHAAHAVAAQPEEPLLSDARHPEHARFRQALAAVHRLDATLGRSPDADSARLAAAIVVQARLHGLDRIDHVVPGATGGTVFAVHGALDDPARRMVHLSSAIALATPVEESSRLAAPGSPVLAHAAPAHAPAVTQASLASSRASR